MELHSEPGCAGGSRGWTEVDLPTAFVGMGPGAKSADSTEHRESFQCKKASSATHTFFEKLIFTALLPCSSHDKWDAGEG